MKTTKVLFLFDKPADMFTNEDEVSSLGVFAYFPDVPYFVNGYRPDDNVSYSHIGQHSPCNKDYAVECKEADYDSYSDLKIELEGIGYKLEVLNIDFQRQDAIKKGKVWQVYYDNNKEDHLFEGVKSQCLKFISGNNLHRAYIKGDIRLAQVIAEKQTVTQ